MYLIFYLQVFLKVYFSILFLILLYIISFQCEKCNYLALIGGGVSDPFTASETFAPPQYSETCPPPPPIFKTFLRLWTCVWFRVFPPEPEVAVNFVEEPGPKNMPAWNSRSGQFFKLYMTIYLIREMCRQKNR